MILKPLNNFKVMTRTTCISQFPMDYQPPIIIAYRVIMMTQFPAASGDPMRSEFSRQFSFRIQNPVSPGSMRSFWCVWIQVWYMCIFSWSWILYLSDIHPMRTMVSHDSVRILSVYGGIRSLRIDRRIFFWRPTDNQQDLLCYFFSHISICPNCVNVSRYLNQ